MSESTYPVAMTVAVEHGDCTFAFWITTEHHVLTKRMRDAISARLRTEHNIGALDLEITSWSKDARGRISGAGVATSFGRCSPVEEAAPETANAEEPGVSDEIPPEAGDVVQPTSKTSKSPKGEK